MITLEIYDKDRVRQGTIRTYEFVQYTDKFTGIGDFSLSIPLTEVSIPLILNGNYIYFEDGKLGVIKYRKKETTDYGTSTLTIKGYLIDVILSYRSFLLTHDYNGSYTNVARKMVEDLLISNSDARRNISFIKLATDSEFIPATDNISVQYTGKILSDCLDSLLNVIGYGYSLYAKIDNINESEGIFTNIPYFEFRIHEPVDRTIDNAYGNTPVVFSESMNNLRTMMYEEDGTTYCNVAFVAGEGEGVERTNIETGDTTASGIDRIELYVDARDLRSETNEKKLTENEYKAILKQRGKEKLQEKILFISFSGTIVTSGTMYEYGVDFKNGDYVTLNDEDLGISVNAQITAVTKSLTKQGELLDVTFGYERATISKLLK